VNIYANANANANWRHLQAFVWLRWRLMVNLWHRSGDLNAALMMILLFLALGMAIPMFIASFLIGLYAIPRAAPVDLMYAWDWIVAGFLVFWTVGLIGELQRSEPLSLGRFLHLPVSVNGAFLINYLSSLCRLSLLSFGPGMLGFSLALVVAKGILLLPVLPLLAAFLLMITALTYQFQGWLAALMSNPRRRRTIVVAMSAIFILFAQVPNLLNVVTNVRAPRPADANATLKTELAKLERARRAGELDVAEHMRRLEEVTQNHERARQQALLDRKEHWEQTALLVNLCLPVGWLPLGVATAAQGRVLPSILGLVGMTLIGTVSLRRAYRTTLRQYQGEATGKRGRAARIVPVAATALEGVRKPKPGALLLEARVYGVSEPAAAVALGGLRSLVRSPEGKMMLLTPLIMSAIFVPVLLQVSRNIAESFRPLVAMGGMYFVLLGLVQLMGNQFGFDRDGFRVFVLSPAPRRDILLGKNLGFAPIVLGLGAILLSIVQVICPMRLDHFFAMFPQYISMFLLFCIFANLVSIYAPVQVAIGALKPSNLKLSTVLLQLVMVMVLFPLTQAPILLPLGIEALLRLLGWSADAPVCLVLALAECAVVVVIYRFALDWQGGQLQAREQRILDVVTYRAP
jgi:hypothetical protein